MLYVPVFWSPDTIQLSTGEAPLCLRGEQYKNSTHNNTNNNVYTSCVK